jgi:hypothetical protein
MPGTLISKDSHIVTRDELPLIPTPPATATWKPIAHYDLIQALDRQLAVRDIRVVKEEFALTHHGLRLFGVLELAVTGMNGGSGEDYNFTMGIRTANDRSFATQLVAGARVLVCSNLAFSGDLIAMNRKHTAKFDLNADLSRAVDRYQVHLATFGGKFDALKRRSLTLTEAKALIFDALEGGVIPPRIFPAVLEAYRTYPGQITAWAVHNMMTSAFKQLAPAALFHATTRLGKLFELTEQ